MDGWMDIGQVAVGGAPRSVCAGSHASVLFMFVEQVDKRFKAEAPAESLEYCNWA